MMMRGGMGNMQKMMKQMQKMQKEMQKAQEELAEKKWRELLAAVWSRLLQTDIRKF